jgi:hypothetical protein
VNFGWKLSISQREIILELGLSFEIPEIIIVGIPGIIIVGIPVIRIVGVHGKYKKVYKKECYCLASNSIRGHLVNFKR